VALADASSYALAAVNAAGGLGFALLAVRLYRVYAALGSSLDAPAAFAALALAQAAGALAHLSEGRLAFSLYTATGALTAAAILSMMLSGGHGRQAAAAVPLAAALPAASDAAALLASALGAARFRGAARLLSAMLAAGFALRLASLALLPSQAGVAALAAGEVLRASSAAAMALRYSAPAVGGVWLGGRGGGSR
jgi:hypothetical protein